MKTALLCLALNVYYEANLEPTNGKYAVAHVAMNRAQESGDSICKVVYKPSQFSWTLKPQPAPKGQGWTDAKNIACTVLKGESQDPTRGSTFFHNSTVKPTWASKLKKVIKIGGHTFYKPRIARQEDILHDINARHISIIGIRFNKSLPKESTALLPLRKHTNKLRDKRVPNRDSGCWV